MSRAFPQIGMEPVYGFCHYLAAVLHEISFRGDVVGVNLLPKTGGHLVAANHASHLDPFILGSQIPRQVTFFARKTLWKPGFPAWWLNRVLAAIKQERVIIMFPEGTRSPDGLLQKPKPGVGLFACRTQVSVVPARLFGSFEAFDRRGRLRFGAPVTVVFGRPIPPAVYDDPAAGKERYQVASERIMAEIAKLQLPPVTVI